MKGFSVLALFLCGAPAVASSARTFERLSPQIQDQVKKNYGDLLACHERRDFECMRVNAESILVFLDEYRDTKSYLVIAKRELAPREETPGEKRIAEKRELIARLELEGGALVKKAETDVSARTKLYGVVDRLLGLDPKNEFPAEWKKRLREATR
jgi:hypothetical protein